MKFCTRIRLKPFNDRGEFELDRAKSKNYIAENSVALGYDTHNSCTLHKESCGFNRLVYFLHFVAHLFAFGNFNCYSTEHK